MHLLCTRRLYIDIQYYYDEPFCLEKLENYKNKTRLSLITLTVMSRRN